VTVGSVLSLVVLGLYMLRCGTVRRGTDVPQSRRTIAADLLRIGVPVTIGAGGMSLITLLDQMLVMSTLQDKLGLSEGAATALYGEYTFGMTLFNLPSSFIYPVTISLIPAIGAALARGEAENARSQTETAFRVTALLALPAGAGLSVLAGPILNLLYPAVPETAAAAAYYLSVLGIACIFVCLMVMTGGVLQAYGHEYIPVLSLLCGGALKVVANHLLVADPNVGIRGAAVGTLCCYVLITLINLIAIHRLVPRRPDYFAVFAKPVLATAAMAVVARGSYTLLYRLMDGSRLAVLLAIALAVVVYAMAALLLGAIRRQDLSALPKGEKIADLLRIH
jgi:stage V sporulation protein B